MKYSRVTENELQQIKQKLGVSLHTLYETVDEILSYVNPRNKELLDEFGFVYNEDRRESGWFTYEVRGFPYTKITVNLAKVRTFRDFVFSVFHEWKHVEQYGNVGVSVMRSLTRMKNGEYSYNIMEREADRFAFREEFSWDYENFVINPDVPFSIFVERKKTAAFDS